MAAILSQPQCVNKVIPSFSPLHVIHQWPSYMYINWQLHIASQTYTIGTQCLVMETFPPMNKALVSWAATFGLGLKENPFTPSHVSFHSEQGKIHRLTNSDPHSLSSLDYRETINFGHACWTRAYELSLYECWLEVPCFIFLFKTWIVSQKFMIFFIKMFRNEKGI